MLNNLGPVLKFGTRGSEVQILSPRPTFSITCKSLGRPTWFWPRCPSWQKRINIGFSTKSGMPQHLQKYLQPFGVNPSAETVSYCYTCIVFVGEPFT